MKKHISLVVLLALAELAPYPALAARRKHHQQPQPQAEPIPDADSCGLGWQVTQKRTLSAMTTRSTTNVGTVLPSFGMTSGTIGCKQMPLSDEDKTAAHYAYNNLDVLSAEMAEGRGENLVAFGRTLGCSDAAMPEFERQVQTHFREIVGAPVQPENKTTDALRILKNVKVELQTDPLLASGCGYSA